jgi:hypothetical protein
MGAHRADFLATLVFYRGYGKRVAEQFVWPSIRWTSIEEAMLYEGPALCLKPFIPFVMLSWEKWMLRDAPESPQQAVEP